MPRNKSTDPDGYTVEFFLAAWEVVGTLFTAAIRDFFPSGKLPRQISSTSLALVPKVAKPTKFTDFRPIACCNIVISVFQRF